MSATHVDATFYVQIKPTWSYWNNPVTGEKEVDGAKVAGVTQNRPTSKGGAVVVKLTVRVPVGVFLPLRPEAVIVIPESMIQVNPVEVLAEDPMEES
jgi:hypothetical protein